MRLKLFSKKTVPLFTLFCLAFLIFSVFDFAKNSSGHLMGFVYDEDGKSPLQDAIVLLKGVDTDKAYQSKPTGKTGDYRILDIDVGTYILGLKVNEKNFNVDDLVTVADGKTGIFSLSLDPLPGQGGASPDELGWCCHDGKVFQSTREECDKREGKFFTTKKKAKKRCSTPIFFFFNSATGIALLTAGTSAVTLGIINLTKGNEDIEVEVSPTKR